MAKVKSKTDGQRLKEAVKGAFGGKIPASVDPGRFDQLNNLASLFNPRSGNVCKEVPKDETHVVILEGLLNPSKIGKHNVLAYYNGEEGEAFLCSGVILFKSHSGFWQRF